VALPEARELIDAELRARREELTRRLQEEFTGLTEQVDMLRTEVDALAERKAALHTEAAVLNADIVRLRSEATEETDRRIARIAEAVAERVNAGAAMVMAGGLAAPPHASSVLRLPITPRPDALPAQDQDALRRFQRRLGTVGICSDAAEPFLAAVLTGVTPVVIGPAAGMFLQEAGVFLFGGYTLRRTVTPFVTECADFFGRPHSASCTYRPDPERLADLLLTSQGNTLHLVTFDGFNRCESEAAFDPMRPDYDGPLPALHPGSVRPDDPYYALAEAAWPKTFIAALRYVADGGRPSPAFWAKSAVVVATYQPREKRGSPDKPVYLNAAYIAELRRGAAARQDEAAQLVRSDEFREAWHLTARFGLDAASFVAGLIYLGVESREALRSAGESLAAPLMIRLGEKPSGWLADGLQTVREALDAS
jgi:hypothetical protein